MVPRNIPERLKCVGCNATLNRIGLTSEVEQWRAFYQCRKCKTTYTLVAQPSMEET